MTIAFQIRTYKKNDGTQPLRLRISSSSKDTQYINTGISIMPNQWDSKRQIIKKHHSEEQLNGKLTNLKIHVESIYYKNIGASAKRIMYIYKERQKYNTSSFLEYFQALINEMKLKQKFRSARTNQNYLNKIKMFSSHVQFSDLSVQFAQDYEIFLIKRGNKVNTIASSFKAIYATLNKAVNSGLIDKNPFKGYTIVTENVEKQTLTIDQIQLISDYDIPSQFKGKVKAKDIFLFSFYSAGMRFTDVCKLQWSNIIGNDIVYTMNKSRQRSGSRRTIPLNPKSIGIIDKYKGKNKKYIFPPLYGYENKSLEDIEYRIYIRNNALNRSLKYIATDLDININLSMHISKHSFADYAVKNDVGLLMLSKLLGHTKLATTEHYLKDFYKKQESEAMNKLFG